jgi:hypothetical protein
MRRTGVRGVEHAALANGWNRSLTVNRPCPIAEIQTEEADVRNCGQGLLEPSRGTDAEARE